MLTTEFAGRETGVAPMMARPEQNGRGAERGVPTQLVQFMLILSRRKWVVAGCIIGALLLGAIVTFLMVPQYTANASLEIQRENQNLIQVRGAEQDSQTLDQEFYETQYGLLKSRALAERVVVNLRLIDNQHFFEVFRVRGSDGWFTGGHIKSAAPSRQDRTRLASSLVLDRLSVKPERLSRLVDISFTSPDPQLSKQVVDAWTSNFINLTLERRFGATTYARTFLEGRLEQLRERIDESERKLVGYAANQGIVNVATENGAANGATVDRPLLDDTLSSFSRELSSATADRIKAQSRLAMGGGASEALDNTAINAMRERRGELAADYAKMMAQFAPDYPPAKALQTQIAQLDREIGKEEGRVQNSLRQTYQASLSREQGLRNQVSSVQSNVLDLRRRSIQYNIYQRDVDTNRQLYDALLQRYKEIGVAGGVGVNNILTVDPAEVPTSPSSPRLPLNMALALLAGLALGISAAIALEQFDQGISDPGEVEAVLDVPLLGTVPKVLDSDPRGALVDRKSAISEAYFSVQTSLSFSTPHGIPTTLAITSTRPAEGKSTTAFAIARSLARSGRRVVLVDADMRSPSVHKMLDLGNGYGLSNYLAGEDAVPTLIQPTAFDNFSIMAAGPQPPSAAELLVSDRLDHLFRALDEMFDHVIVDAPPVMGLADAPLIGSRVEGVIFVVESRQTPKNMAHVAIGRLAATSAQILGAVLVKFDPRNLARGYGYGYGYGYGENARENEPAS